MRRCTSKITRAFPKPCAICERTSRLTIRSGFINRWTIKRQRRSIRADKTSFLEWLGFVLFSTKNCLDFWDHHSLAKGILGKVKIVAYIIENADYLRDRNFSWNGLLKWIVALRTDKTFD